jgi:hypothetical protein
MITRVTCNGLVVTAPACEAVKVFYLHKGKVYCEGII